MPKKVVSIGLDIVLDESANSNDVLFRINNVLYDNNIYVIGSMVVGDSTEFYEDRLEDIEEVC